jgi:hypothetical protein
MAVAVSVGLSDIGGDDEGKKQNTTIQKVRDEAEHTS